MQDSIPSYAVRKSPGKTLAWSAVSGILLGFSIPSWQNIESVYGNGNIKWWPLLITVCWSAAFFISGLWLLYRTLFKLRFSIRHQTLCVTRSLGPVRFSKYLDGFNDIYLLKEVRDNEGSSRIVDIVVARKGRDKKLLLDSDFATVPHTFLDWIKSQPSLVVHDLRHRKLLKSRK